MRPRDVVDYALQRRARLADLATGRVSTWDACDAHPHLRLAARHYGQPSPVGCPVCRSKKMVDVHFVYGDALRLAAGQAKHPRELERMAGTIAEFTVYAVEVCPDCGWNHLVRRFVLGRGEDGSSQIAQGR